MSSSETQAQATVPETERRNPLLDLSPHRLEIWDDWCEMLFNPETPLEVQIGLLHCGFEVNGKRYNSTAPERKALYLQMADSHDNLYDLYNRDLDVVDGRRISGHEEHRRALATKAFAVVSEKLFRQTPEREGGRIVSHTWLWQDDLLELFVWFMRGSDWPANTHRTHNLQSPEGRGSKPMEWAVGLGKWLCGLAFFSELDLDDRWGRQDDVAFNRRLIALRPQLLPFMRAFKLLGLTEALGENLDKPTLTALRKMAMSEKIGYGDRKPTSVKEAAAAGSYPGRVCYMIDTIIEENKRQRELYEAQAEAREAAAQAREAKKRARQLSKPTRTR